MTLRFVRIGLAILLSQSATGAGAQDSAVPYWASLSSDEVNLRVGPGSHYRIQWVYRREGLPVRVIRLTEDWRYIEDPDGVRGWVSRSLLTRDRGAIVIGEGLAPIRSEADPSGRLRWQAEPGVSGALGTCRDNWCQIDIGGRSGWIEAARLWGDGEP